MGPFAEPPKARPAEELRFEAFLRSKKLKLTGERLAILAAIFQRETHFDAEALHAQLRKAGGDISRAHGLSHPSTCWCRLDWSAKTAWAPATPTTKPPTATSTTII